MSLLVRFKGGSVCRELSQRHLNRPRDPPSAGPTASNDPISTTPVRTVGRLAVVERCARDRLPAGIRGGCDGDARVDPVPRALSSAQPLAPIIGEQLHMSAQTLSLSSGLANAAYAVGTVLAVQFAQHFRSAGCWSATRCCS